MVVNYRIAESCILKGRRQVFKNFLENSMVLIVKGLVILIQA
jgi:hypothetical protein